MSFAQSLNQSLNSNATHCQVGVVGAGSVANAAVLMAAQLGLSVVQVVPDAGAPAGISQDAASVPRAFAIAPRVQSRLDALGVWGLLGAQQVQPAVRMQVFWESAAGQALLPLAAQDAGAAHLCSFVAEHDLASALATAVQVAARQRRVLRASVTAVQPSPLGTQLILSSGEAVHCDLVIAADGAHSPLRKLLALEPTVYDYGHSAVVAVVHAANPHTSTAWQWLAANGSVLALLPLPASVTVSESTAPSAASYGLVWSQAHAAASAHQQNPAALLAALNAQCAAHTGALSLGSAVQSFPLSRASAPQLTQGGVVLVGDAAHRIHPLAGQGLNLGFEDVFALGDILAARGWRSCNDARLLARYRRARAWPLASVGAAVHGLARRGDWPAAAQSLAVQGLAMMERHTVLGTWFRRKIVGHMV